MKRFIITILTAAFFAPAVLYADTIYFNNGGSVDGIIRKESAYSVEMDVGFGTITCDKREIKEIARSTPEEADALTERWAKKREELKAAEKEFARERQKRFEEYEEWTRQERARQEKEQALQGTVDLTRDPETHSILVDATLNDTVRATLVLDTGASIVVLTRRMGEALGLDLSDTKNNVVTLQLAGDHKVSAKLVMLKSIRIKEFEVKDVMAGVMLETGGPGFKDGLLGMTFLSKFNLKIDLKNMRMALEKSG